MQKEAMVEEYPIPIEISYLSCEDSINPHFSVVQIECDGKKLISRRPPW